MRTRRGLPAWSAARARGVRPAGRRVRHPQPDRAGPARGARRPAHPAGHAAATAATGSSGDDGARGRRPHGLADDPGRSRRHCEAGETMRTVTVTGLLHAQGADGRHRRLPLLRPRPEGRPRRVRHGLRHRARTTRRGAPRHPLPRASVGSLGGPRQGRRERRQRLDLFRRHRTRARAARASTTRRGWAPGRRAAARTSCLPTSASRCSAARCSSCRCTTTSGTG